MYVQSKITGITRNIAKPEILISVFSKKSGLEGVSA
jgi:hypothetical protein